MKTKTSPKLEDLKLDIQTQVRLGQINFINCLPINLPLSHYLQAFTPINITIYDSVPSDLNKKLREGDLDIAPISSFEYLSNKDQYELIDTISISSKVQADSVLFFIKDENFWSGSKKRTIHLTDKSATSVNLLKVLLKNSFKLNLEDIEFVRFSENSDDFQAKLLIGDEALKEKQDNYSQVLDLGEQWYELTGLPMVFGLWTARKDIFTKDEMKQIKTFFKNLKEIGFGTLYADMIIAAYKQSGLGKMALRGYFNNLDYKFSEKEAQSLKLFEEYLSAL